MVCSNMNTAMRLEDILPQYDFHEVHTITVQASPERVFRAIKEITPGEIPLFRAMFALRALPALPLHRRGGIPFGGKEPLLLQAQRGGFIVLAEDPNQELVVGAIGQFWQISGNIVKVPDAPAFLAFEDANYAKTALNFYVQENSAGRTTVSTETRIQIADPQARRKFAAYWLLIGWGSGLIRRMWLRVIKQRAEKSE